MLLAFHRIATGSLAKRWEFSCPHDSSCLANDTCLWGLERERGKESLFSIFLILPLEDSFHRLLSKEKWPSSTDRIRYLNWG